MTEQCTDPTRASGAWRRAAAFLCVAVAAIAVASALDAPVAEYFARRQLSFSLELYAMFRLAGYLPLWLVVAVALALIDSPLGWRAAWSRGGVLLTSVVLAGASAEILKMVVRRERPSVPFTDYVFRPWWQDTFSSGGLGWPSSHVAVAFGAVWVLSRLYPRAAVVWILVGCACAVSRLVGNDHYVSDVVGAAVLAYGVMMLLPLQRRPPQFSPVAPPR